VAVNYAQVSPTFMQSWYALESGIFAKNGLDITLQLAQSAPGMASLLSGQTQLGLMGGNEVANASVQGGDLVVVASLAPLYPYVLEVQGNIKTGADLKGTKIGITQFGSTIDAATRVALKQLGLSANDVNLLQLTSISARTEALLNNAIQAGLSNPPDSLVLEAHGLHVLVDLAELKAPASSILLAGTRTWVNGHHDATQKFVDSIVEATAQQKTDKAGTIAVIKKYLKYDNQQDLEATYNYYVGRVFPPLPMPAADQFADVISLATNPNVKAFDPNKVIDTSFVKSAQDRGLDKPRG
jgi:ABC-type nitrate/sulfonate/bicarbonate transport system substrate-binding protein